MSALMDAATGVGDAWPGLRQPRLVDPTPVACITCGAPSMPGDWLCLPCGGMSDGAARHAAMTRSQ